METMTLKKAVLTVFDSLPVGSEFYANQLKAKAAELELHVDVLADAIQTVDESITAPRWNDTP